MLKALGQCPDSPYEPGENVTQCRGVKGSEAEWKTYMDMNFIRKAFLKVLILERSLKENMKLKCSVVKFSVNRREGREGIPGRGTAGASALGQDSMWNVRCLAWLELLAEMSWELFFHFQS